MRLLGEVSVSFGDIGRGRGTRGHSVLYVIHAESVCSCCLELKRSYGGWFIGPEPSANETIFVNMSCKSKKEVDWGISWTCKTICFHTYQKSQPSAAEPRCRPDSAMLKYNQSVNDISELYSITTTT